MSIASSIRAKGVGGVAARAGMIASRFAVTPGRMERYLDRYVDLTEEFGTAPSWPITARVLDRHPRLIHRLAHERGVEFAIHGLVHSDHRTLNADEQHDSIAKAGALFDRADVPYAGFRGPYLGYNGDTHDAVRALGMAYHSSQAVNVAALPAHRAAAPGYRRALELYGALDASRVAVRPRMRDGLVDIPVTVPDDEIMVDRLRMPAHEQAAVWLDILENTYTRGDLFTMQFHPERINETGDALRAVLAGARRRNPAVWIAPMREIAEWWRARSESRLCVEETAEGRYRVAAEGPCGLTVLVRGAADAPADAWYGRERRAATASFEMAAARKPVVGASPRTGAAALALLREEGFPVEVSEDRTRYGAFVDLPGGIADEAAALAAVEATEGPLVRLGRWPDGARSALSVTGDIDSITLQDFALRLRETRSQAKRMEKTARRALESVGPA